MSSLDRSVSGEVMIVRMADERSRLLGTPMIAPHGRSARTIAKVGPLRVTLVALSAHGDVAPHHAESPVSIHVLEGRVRCTAAGTEHVLGAGDLAVLAAGVEHALVADGATAIFLLTIAT